MFSNKAAEFFCPHDYLYKWRPILKHMNKSLKSWKTGINKSRDTVPIKRILNSPLLVVPLLHVLLKIALKIFKFFEKFKIVFFTVYKQHSILRHTDSFSGKVFIWLNPRLPPPSPPLPPPSPPHLPKPKILNRHCGAKLLGKSPDFGNFSSHSSNSFNFKFHSLSPITSYTTVRVCYSTLLFHKLTTTTV